MFDCRMQPAFWRWLRCHRVTPRPRRPEARRFKPADCQSDHPRRPDGSCGDRLQLRSRARARHAEHHAAVRQLRSAVHGHRRDGQPRDHPLSIAHQSRRGQRARAELRVRPPRARETAAQVRRPRRHARPHRPEGRQHRAGGSACPAPQLQQRAGLAGRQRRSSPACTPITSASQSCRAISTAVRR